MSEYTPLDLYIGGEWRQGSGGRGEDVINPATGETIGRLPHASAEDLDAALASAESGFQVWRKTSPADRSRIIRKAAELMRENASTIARVCVMEEGKPFGQAMWEVMFTAERMEWVAEEAKRVYGQVLPVGAHGERRSIIYEPVGPSIGLSPWNLPIMMPGTKIAFALAAGCSMIVKPAEETPGTGVLIVKMFEQAGLPKGVLNLVYGAPAQVSSQLIASPITRKVSFTGSVPVGKLLYRQCADTLKKCTLELGGHSPVVVFDDVDVDKVTSIGVMGKYSNAGQMCVAPTRFFVHERIADSFIERFTEKSKALRIGNGLDSSTEMGPMANPRRIEAMEQLVADARDKGANITTGGNRIGNQGYFWEPTVLADVPGSARMMTEEPFGPVAIINRWSNIDDVVAESNALPFGLGSYVYTRSQKWAAEMTDRLEAGMIGINTAHVGGVDAPFGGIKESGLGREAGQEGLKEYLESKIVTQVLM